MKIQCNIDTQRYTSKPLGAEIGGINNRLMYSSSKVSVTLQELTEQLLDGCSFTPARLEGEKRSNKNWASQQVFILDIDNDKKGETLELRDILNLCTQHDIKPFLVYPSFSYTEKKPKFRICFALEAPTIDTSIAEEITTFFLSIFESQADEKCKDLARLYFGTSRKLLNSKNYFQNFEATNNTEALLVRCNTLHSPHTATEATNRVVTPPKPKKPRTEPLNGDNGGITVIESDTPHIQAIKEWNAPKLIELLCVTKLQYRYFEAFIENDPLGDTIIKQGDNRRVICTNKKKLWDAVLYIPLHELLGLPLKKKMRCILPSHTDNSPSANIYQEDSGKYFYKCFGQCNRACTVLSVLGLLSGKSVVECFQFLQTVFNIEIQESEFLQTQKDMLEYFADYIISPEFKIELPSQSAYFSKKRKEHLSNFFRYASQNISETNYFDKLGRPILICDYSKLLQVMNTTSRIQVSENLVLMQVSGYLAKTDDIDLPKKLLTQLNSKRQTASGSAVKITKRTGVYSFPELNTAIFTSAEELITILTGNNVKLTSLNRETVYRAMGQASADTLFPQYKKENAQGTSNQSNDKTEQITQAILSQIESCGFCLEKELVNIPMTYTRANGQKIPYRRQEIANQIKKSIGEICNTHGLIRTKAYKAVQEKLGLVGMHANTIIIIKQ